jgi:hypothetical protein
MTKEQLAEKLNGREYCDEITAAEEAQAKAAGLVVIFGASDDLCEFRGAINDEVDCYGGGRAKIHADGVFDARHEGCDCEHCGYKTIAAKCAAIEAVWSETPDISWTYKTTLPHATFEIMEDGEKYCRGIVIAAADLPKL